MRRRLLRSTLLIALAAIVVLGVPLGVVGTALLHQRADMRLERRADAVVLRISRAAARGVPLSLDLVRDLVPQGQAVEITRGGRRTILGRPPEGDVARVTSGDDGPLRATLVVPRGVRSDDVGGVWLALAGLSAVALAAAVALATVQACRLAAPLEQLARRVERVGDPTYDDREVGGGLPEVDRLQRALNDADARVTALIRREREFTANVSHQLRTPLTGLRMRLEEIAALADTPAAAEEARAALQQTDRLVRTIEHLEDVARRRDDAPPALDVGAVVAAHTGREGWPARFAVDRRRLDVASRPGVLAHASPESVRQLVDVLLDNALRHGEGATTLEVAERAGFVRVRVRDEGALDPADAAALFVRGFGRGSGIGLAVGRELARRDGGDLVLVATSPTTVEVVLAAARSGEAGGEG